MVDQAYLSTLRTLILRKGPQQATFGLYLADDVSQGLYIFTVEPKSPAADANIQPGDRLVAVNGQWIRSMLKNPKQTVLELAQRVRTLTVTIQPSDLLDCLEVLLQMPDFHPSIPHPRTILVDRDFER